MKSLALSIDIGQDFCLSKDAAGNCVGISSRYSALSDLGKFVSTILPNVLIIAGIVFFFLLILFGFSYIVESGQESPERIRKVNQRLTSALIGFLIVFSSYWLIKIIEVISGFKIFSK